MEDNPAYGISSEINRTVENEYETIATTIASTDKNRINIVRLRAVPKCSTVAFVLSTLALVVTVVCLVLMFVACFFLVFKLPQNTKTTQGGNYSSLYSIGSHAEITCLKIALAALSVLEMVQQLIMSCVVIYKSTVKKRMQDALWSVVVIELVGMQILFVAEIETV